MNTFFNNRALGWVLLGFMVVLLLAGAAFSVWISDPQPLITTAVIAGTGIAVHAFRLLAKNNRE